MRVALVSSVVEVALRLGDLLADRFSALLDGGLLAVEIDEKFTRGAPQVGILQKRRPRGLDAVGRQGPAALEAHALHRLRLQRGFRLIDGGLKLLRRGRWRA